MMLSLQFWDFVLYHGCIKCEYLHTGQCHQLWGVCMLSGWMGRWTHFSKWTRIDEWEDKHSSVGEHYLLSDDGLSEHCLLNVMVNTSVSGHYYCRGILLKFVKIFEIEEKFTDKKEYQYFPCKVLKQSSNTEFVLCLRDQRVAMVTTTATFHRELSTSFWIKLRMKWIHTLLFSQVKGSGVVGSYLT